MSQLVDHYRSHHAQAFSQLESMVSELAKLTVLLHEECHGALTDIQVTLA